MSECQFLPRRAITERPAAEKGGSEKERGCFPSAQEGGSCSFTIANLERRTVSACLCFITETFTVCQNGPWSSLLRARCGPFQDITHRALAG